MRILNQFEEFGNYRFHYYVTGNTILELISELGIGNGRVSSIVSTVGSAGTISCGDRVKEVFPEVKIVAGEPVQCPTLSLNGYGGHDIQGIGDKHVTWIHNVMNTDAVVALDDIECKKVLQTITDEVGQTFMKEFIKGSDVDSMADTLGISGVANVLGAIKIAKHYRMTSQDNIVTIATDSMDRYHSVMENMTKTYGRLDRNEAKHRFESIVLDAKTDWIFEGTMDNRLRWHNLKYYTWVEQQGKDVEELNSTMSQAFWKEEASRIEETDEMLVDYRRKL